MLEGVRPIISEINFSNFKVVAYVSVYAARCGGEYVERAFTTGLQRGSAQAWATGWLKAESTACPKRAYEYGILNTRFMCSAHNERGIISRAVTCPPGLAGLYFLPRMAALYGVVDSKIMLITKDSNGQRGPCDGGGVLVADDGAIDDQLTSRLVRPFLSVSSLSLLIGSALGVRCFLAADDAVFYTGKPP